MSAMYLRIIKDSNTHDRSRSLETISHCFSSNFCHQAHATMLRLLFNSPNSSIYCSPGHFTFCKDDIIGSLKLDEQIALLFFKPDKGEHFKHH